MTEQKRGRGRPRPQETIARDALTLRLLRRSRLTRDELAQRLDCTSHLAYLSLWRLQQDGLVRRVPNTANGRTNVWEVISKTR